jgi:hypothetical protein
VIHLSDRQVENYRLRVLSAHELLAVDDHIAACPECRMRLAEGESLSGSLAAWEALGESAAPPLPPPLAIPGLSFSEQIRPFFAAASILVVAVGLAIGLARWSPKPTVELADGVRTVRLGSHGELAGLEPLPEPQQRAVAAALRSGRLDPPWEIAGLAGSTSVLRGEGAAPPGFALLSPLATAVLDGQPVFRWTPLPGGETYQVKVFDSSLSPVDGSGPVTGTEWRSSRPLPPGVYAWQVVARRGGEDRTAPGPGSPPAQFRVLLPDQARAVEREAKAAGGSHLALGVLYASHGLAGEAERELEQVAAANPRSATARSLLASVRLWRAGSSQLPSPTSTNGAQ